MIPRELRDLVASWRPLVLAPDLRRAEWYMRQLDLGPRDWRYISSSWALRGHRNPVVFEIQDWVWGCMTGNEKQEVLHALKSADAHVVYLPDNEEYSPEDWIKKTIDVLIEAAQQRLQEA